MFDSLVDNMDTEKWEEIDVAKKTGNYQEFHVNRAHKRATDTTIGYLIALEDGDPKNVELKDVLPQKDPLKDVAVVEILLSEDEKEIVGMDLNGDVIVRKG